MDNRTILSRTTWNTSTSQKHFVPARPAVGEPKRLWQTDLALCQKRADTISARGWRIHAVVWHVCEPESVNTFMPRQRRFQGVSIIIIFPT